jgi:hypothetical protein
MTRVRNTTTNRCFSCASNFPLRFGRYGLHSKMLKYLAATVSLMPHHNAIIHNYYWLETVCTCALWQGDFNFENDSSPEMFVVVLENTGILSPNKSDRVQPHNVKIPVNNHTGISLLFRYTAEVFAKMLNRKNWQKYLLRYWYLRERYLKHNTRSWHA